MELMLSVMAIAKNEAANIRGFLESWLPVADELVILDTGSNLEQFRAMTEAIMAREDKAKIKVHITVADQPFHFAQARNKAKASCRGRWILWADLDDRVDQASIPAIRDIAEKCDRANAFAFQVYSPTPSGTAHRFMQVRMFLNHSAISWSGACHETVDASLAAMDMPVQEVPEIIIAHLGYQDQKTKEAKARRNLGILLGSGVRDVAACAHIGDSFYVLGEWSQGLRYFTTAYVQDPSWKARLAEKIFIGHFRLGHTLDAQEWLEAMPDGIAKAFWSGEMAWCQGKMGEALDSYKQALMASPTLSFAGSHEEALVKMAEEKMAAGQAAGRGE